MAPGLDGEPGVEQQRAEIEAAFRQGWRAIGAGKRRVLTERAYNEARQVLDHGGWTGMDKAAIDAVRGGARPGDPLPPLQPRPYVGGVTDADVIIAGVGPQQRVVVLFSHRDFPGARFGHRFSGYDPALERIEFKEEIETGALHRLMQSHPTPDHAGVIWTAWEDPDQD